MKNRLGMLLAALLCAAISLVPSAPASARGPRGCNAPTQRPMRVALPGHPYSSAVTPDGCWVFVSIVSANPASPNGLAILRRRDGSVTLQRVVHVENGLRSIVMSHDGKLLIGADDDYVVFFSVDKLLNEELHPLLGYVSDGQVPGTSAVVVTRDDRYVFALDRNNADASVIDLRRAVATNFSRSSVVGQVPLDLSPSTLAFSPDNRYLYVTSESALQKYNMPNECKAEVAGPASTEAVAPKGVLSVVDVRKAESDPQNAVLYRVPAGCSTSGLAVSPDGRTIWVTARGSGELLAFDAAKLAEKSGAVDPAAVSLGGSPEPVAVVRRGSAVVVGNTDRFAPDQSQARTVSVVDARDALSAEPAVIGSVAVGSFPRAIDKSPDERTLFISNYNSNSLDVIDVDALPVR